MARSRGPEPKKGREPRKSMATPRKASTGEPRRPAETPEVPRATATTEAARASRTADRKKEREARDRRQRITMIIVVVAAVVAVFALMFFVSTVPVEAPVPTESVSRYADLQQSRTEQGYARLGDPRAPVPVALYCDFDSEACRTFHDQVFDPIIERVRTGDISFAFVPLYGRVGNSEGASRAAVCAGQQGGFWRMADALYLWLAQYGQVQAFTNNRILSGVSNLGLDRMAFDGCIAGDSPAEVINAAVQEVTGLTNFRGAPAVAVNGVLIVDDTNLTVTDSDGVLAAIDRAVAQFKAAQGPAATPEATAEATSEPTEAAIVATAEATSPVVATPEATSPVSVLTTEATVEATPLLGGG